MKKNIVFVANTEFHLFVSLIFFFRNYSNSYDYFFVLVKQGNRFNNKFKFNINANFIALNNFLLSNDRNEYFFFKSKITPILSNAKEVYLFLDNDFLNTIIINLAKTNNAKLYLIQDGLNAYTSPLPKVKKYIKYLIYKYIYKYKHLEFFSEWGINPKIDETYVTHPSYFKKINSSNISQLTYEIENRVLVKIEGIFNLPNDVSFPSNSILFISQGVINSRNLEVEERVLIKLQDYCLKNNINLFYKSHPREILTTRIKDKLNNASIINDNVPVELLLNKFKNSVIISWYSAALLNKDNNMHIWLYPLIKTKIDLPQFENVIVIDAISKLMSRINSYMELNQ